MRSNYRPPSAEELSTVTLLMKSRNNCLPVAKFINFLPRFLCVAASTVDLNIYAVGTIALNVEMRSPKDRQ
jgi:hypothetical protein